ncbi:MAG TPA: potassium channel family protein [Candidatus Hydrogenedentes bacterium]|nr:potassium channel family protein [Candidatus Hydrogenedentota bacterium]
MAGRLYTPVRLPGLKSVLIRFAILLSVLAATVLILYFEKGLEDTQTGKHPGFADCIYFTMVTITTVGYGDIVPVDTTSRLIDALLLTPVRFFVIFVFFGTAYQLIIKRFQEEYRMKHAVGKFDAHVIVCGFGATGRAAVQELLLQGTPTDQIVVLDLAEDALKEAVETGVVAVSGDATRENVLKSVAIERATNVLVCPGRDDTAVLVALTVRDLNAEAHVIAMCHEQENAKLLERSGAHTIVSRAAAGGNLMAAATRRAHIVETMQDLLSVGGSLQLDERPVAPSEVEKHPAQLENVAVVRVYRGEKRFDLAALPTLETNDTIVFIKAGAPEHA